MRRLGALPASPRRLAVLAACETAVSAAMNVSDEFEGLSSEFIEVGYVGVIATSWSVETSATDAIMAEFWSNLENPDGRVSPASALRAAQLTWLSRSSEARHVRGLARASEGAESAFIDETTGDLLPPHSSPFWWAGFRLIGT